MADAGGRSEAGPRWPGPSHLTTTRDPFPMSRITVAGRESTNFKQETQHNIRRQAADPNPADVLRGALFSHTQLQVSGLRVFALEPKLSSPARSCSAPSALRCRNGGTEGFSTQKSGMHTGPLSALPSSRRLPSILVVCQAPVALTAGL